MILRCLGLRAIDLFINDTSKQTTKKNKSSKKLKAYRGNDFGELAFNVVPYIIHHTRISPE